MGNASADLKGKRTCGSSNHVSSPTAKAPGQGAAAAAVDGAPVQVGGCLGCVGGVGGGASGLSLPIANRRKRGVSLEPASPESPELLEQQAPRHDPTCRPTSRKLVVDDEANERREGLVPTRLKKEGTGSTVRFDDSTDVMEITPYSQLSWATSPQADKQSDGGSSFGADSSDDGGSEFGMCTSRLAEAPPSPLRCRPGERTGRATDKRNMEAPDYNFGWRGAVPRQGP